MRHDIARRDSIKARCARAGQDGPGVGGSSRTKHAFPSRAPDRDRDLGALAPLPITMIAPASIRRRQKKSQERVVGVTVPKEYRYYSHFCAAPEKFLEEGVW